MTDQYRVTSPDCWCCPIQDVEVVILIPDVVAYEEVH